MWSGDRGETWSADRTVLVQRDLEFRRLGLVYSLAAFSGGMSV